MDKSDNLSEMRLLVGVGSTERDTRVRRTRNALIRAFNQLFMERGYEDFGIADIAARANVARSTFYQHFAGKDEVLASAASGILRLLADSVLEAEEDPSLAVVLDHFWQIRVQARTVLGNIGKGPVFKIFSALVEARLRAQIDADLLPAIPLRLVAIQLATGQLAMIHEWLFGQYSCTPLELAHAIHSSTRAAARAIVGPGLRLRRRPELI
jgi:AcrR family transcriptional regulator